MNHPQHKTLQFNTAGKLQHLLDTQDIPRDTLHQLFDKADQYLHQIAPEDQPLHNKTVINLFCEPSTRTRISFELAAMRLGAHVVNLDVENSSVVKGETLIDTLKTLQAMHCDILIVRHFENGTAHSLAEHATPGICIINGGDGQNAHPTQALLDTYTIRRHKHSFAALSIAIIGDIKHSRVARSLIHTLKILGTQDIRICAPATLLPEQADTLGVNLYSDASTCVTNADVIVTLRIQKERMQSGLIKNAQHYHQQYGITAERIKLAKPDAIIMHPGPINRGIEIASEVADGPQSVILEQVRNGIAIRMAVMATLISQCNTPNP